MGYPPTSQFCPQRLTRNAPGKDRPKRAGRPRPDQEAQNRSKSFGSAFQAHGEAIAEICQGIIPPDFGQLRIGPGGGILSRQPRRDLVPALAPKAGPDGSRAGGPKISAAFRSGRGRGTDASRVKIHPRHDAGLVGDWFARQALEPKATRRQSRVDLGNVQSRSERRIGSGKLASSPPRRRRAAGELSNRQFSIFNFQFSIPAGPFA
jgi:hypothetical protein